MKSVIAEKDEIIAFKKNELKNMEIELLRAKGLLTSRGIFKDFVLQGVLPTSICEIIKVRSRVHCARHDQEDRGSEGHKYITCLQGEDAPLQQSLGAQEGVPSGGSAVSVGRALAGDTRPALGRRWSARSLCSFLQALFR